MAPIISGKRITKSFVVAVLAVSLLLLLYLWYNYEEASSQRKIKIQMTKIQLVAIQEAVEKYRQDHGKLPRELEELEGSYIKFQPIDTWNNPYHYRTINVQEFEVYSYGSDGKPGGNDLSHDFNLSTDWSVYLDRSN